MLKAISYPLIALMLIFSILAPSIVPLLDVDYEITVLLDSNEEEKNQENESEKKFNEKDLFLTNLISSNFIFISYTDLAHIGYVFHDSDFNGDILVPPPRELV